MLHFFFFVCVVWSAQIQCLKKWPVSQSDISCDQLSYILNCATPQLGSAGWLSAQSRAGASGNTNPILLLSEWEHSYTSLKYQCYLNFSTVIKNFWDISKRPFYFLLLFRTFTFFLPILTTCIIL